MCVVPTLTFERLFAFLVLGHGRRQLLWFEVTRHPTADWLARQITEAFPWASAPSYLVRDNDGAYGHVFSRRVMAMGIRDRPISPRSPWQNGHVERLTGTVRRECLDRMPIFGEAHLPQILTSYASYYNESRPHLSLHKDAPLGRAVQRYGTIAATPVLSGLHHRYAGHDFREGQRSFRPGKAAQYDDRCCLIGPAHQQRSGRGDFVGESRLTHRQAAAVEIKILRRCSQRVLSQPAAMVNKGFQRLNDSKH